MPHTRVYEDVTTSWRTPSLMITKAKIWQSPSTIDSMSMLLIFKMLYYRYWALLIYKHIKLHYIYIYIYICMHTCMYVCIYTYIMQFAVFINKKFIKIKKILNIANCIIYIYIYKMLFAIFIVKLATLVEGDQKAPFSIATTPRCRGRRYSFHWIAPLYPWSLLYIAEC